MQTLTSRVAVAEQNVTMSAPRTEGSSDSGIFDKKRLYTKELKENTSFRSWSERLIAWVAMDNEEIARAFHRAGKQEQPLDTLGLSDLQTSYSRALYGHLRALTEGYRKAAKFVRLRTAMALRRGAVLLLSLIPRIPKCTQPSLSTL